MTTVSTKRLTPERVTEPERVNGDAPGGRLLESKLAIPKPVFRVLGRARLSSLLDLSTQHRISLISAPAGSGKTTSCASWAQGRIHATRIAWLSLDHADNDPVRFRSYLLAALRRAEPALNEIAHDLQRGSADDFPLPLIRAAERFSEPLILVLDDVHELANPEVLGWLDQLTRYAPPMFRLILSGRRAPPLQLARLRVSGELADIDTADLACTPDEADAYFAMLGLRVDRIDRDELLRRTEGWMAGIRLAALRTRAHSGNVRVTDIAGDDPIVTDYLRDEVLTGQDPQTRVFLLRTSIAPHLTGKLADALTSTADGARSLDRLSRENSFVQALDSERTWYRYHPLLRELLLADLRREMPHEIPILLRRAARWYTQHGRPVEALRSSVEGQDWDYTAQVLAGSDIAILLSRGPAELERVIAPVPPDLAFDDVAVGAAWAAARLWTRDPDGADALLEAADTALDRAATPVRRIVEPKLAALRLLQASCRTCADPGLLARAASQADQATHLASTQPEHRAAGFLWWALGVALLRLAELPQARMALRAADRELGAGDFAELQLRARAWSAIGEAWHGNLRTADAVAAEVLGGEVRGGEVPGGEVLGREVLGTEAIGTDTPAALATRNIARLTLAFVSLMRDELAVVHRLLDEIDYQGHQRIPGEPSIVSSAELIRVRALVAQGDTTKARVALMRLQHEFGEATPAVAEAVTFLEGEIALRSGDNDLGRKVIARLAAQDEGSSRAGDRLTLAWLLLASADPQGALQAAEPFIAGPAAEVKVHDQVSALLVCAIAHRRLKAPQRAVAMLEQALLLAEPEGICRVFVDGGAAVRSVLTVLVPPTSRSAGFAGKILQRLDAQIPAGSSTPDGDALPLSDSELAVLRFLPSHLTNEEIGEALFLSVNTVKTHLRSAYRKLGVRSRREAIALARNRGLVA
ncbi:MAG TPA: LuxR C-terminal-related transcriptional regulator [Streptosporangiaceae bacterium]|nr:LuxR C-terminal-related transcriptional regulator [Streptosporangiaceae bacterium]